MQYCCVRVSKVIFLHAYMVCDSIYLRMCLDNLMFQNTSQVEPQCHCLNTDLQ